MVLRISISRIAPGFPKGGSAVGQHMPPAWKIPLVGNTIGHLVQVSFSKHIKHHFGAKYSGGEMPVTFPEGFYHRLNSLFLFCCSARHSCPQGHNLCCLGSFFKLTGGRSVRSDEHTSEL